MGFPPRPSSATLIVRWPNLGQHTFGGNLPKLTGGCLVTQTLLKGILAVGFLLLTDRPAAAQARSAACPPSGKPVHTSMVASVTGCPFSAVMEIIESQTLADGTHIQKRSKTLIYRDSLGRIRYENYSSAPMDKEIPGPPSNIQIFDPVAGFTYWLTPKDAVAARSPLDVPAANQKANTQPQQSAARSSAPPQTVDLKSSHVAEKLGTQLMEGLSVNGRRDTVTIPAEAEGNDRPLVVVSEVWESSDMGIRLLTKNSDPRTRDIEKRMTNLTWTEPDPSLFQVPADYAMKSE